MNRVLASIQLSDTDRKALIVLIILLVVLVLIVGLIGMAINATMKHQAKRADAMMHDVAKTHVVDSTREFRRFGFKKNNRALYRDSIKPFLVALVGLAIWIIYNIATGNWGDNVWEHFGELFVRFKFDNSQYPPEEPLWVKVFGMNILARWPETVEGYPRFEISHLASYIEVALWIVAIVWYAYGCQAYLSRFIRIMRLSNTVYEKSLEGFNANAQVDINPEKPTTPAD
ncbi:MAG: hypothetical protein IJ787_04975 [Bacilli bacterium]|nr:hypothetical protein [Bacilli bacterium]